MCVRARIGRENHPSGGHYCARFHILPENSAPVAGVFTPRGDRMFVPLPGRDAVAVVAVPTFRLEKLVAVGVRPMGATYVENPLPRRQGLAITPGLALASGRIFAANCPDPCCGPVSDTIRAELNALRSKATATN
ncbi:MAG: hypothetical protein EXQ89_03050 [Rhodospirillaceae bacterium]|nr:hypothetical protein [Rhodospirillaceae bacterium]